MPLSPSGRQRSFRKNAHVPGGQMTTGNPVRPSQSRLKSKGSRDRGQADNLVAESHYSVAERFLQRIVSQWRKQPVISNYGVPTLSVGAVLIVGRWLDLYLHAAPVSLFICAVLFSAWFGGFRPGLLATVLSIVAFKYYFVSPIHSLIPETAEIPRLIVFSLAALFVGSLTARQQSATEALRESEQRLRDYADAAKAWLWETGPDHAFSQISEEITTLGIA